MGRGRQALKRGANDWFAAMKNGDGSVVSDLDSICDSWVRFNSSRFSAEEVDLSIQESLLSNISASLSLAYLCEGYLTWDEDFVAPNGMAKAKAPGFDSLTWSLTWLFGMFLSRPCGGFECFF